MPRKLIISFFILVIGLTLFFVFQRPERSLESARPQSPDREVRVVEVVEKGLPLSLSGAGLLAAWTAVDVVAEASGRVLEPPLEVGTECARGDTLVRLDPTSLELELRSRKAGLRQAALALDVARRDAEALQSQAGRRGQRDSLAAGGRLGVAGRSGAGGGPRGPRLSLKTLADTRVKAPFAGRVVRRHVELGAFVAAGQPVARLVDLSRLRLKLGAPAPLAVELEPGGTARLTVDAYPGRLFDGTVHTIAAEADASGLYRVEVAVQNNPHQTLLPGMLARARVSAGQRAARPLVPANALVRRDGQDALFVLEDDRVRLRRVGLGFRHGDICEVVAGVEPGERVVYRGQTALEDGERVRVLSGRLTLAADYLELIATEGP